MNGTIVAQDKKTEVLLLLYFTLAAIYLWNVTKHTKPGTQRALCFTPVLLCNFLCAAHVQPSFFEIHLHQRLLPDHMAGQLQGKSCAMIHASACLSQGPLPSSQIGRMYMQVAGLCLDRGPHVPGA